MPQVIDRCFQLLFWNTKQQKWQTEESFSPNGGETFGMQWFLVPNGFSCYAPDTYRYLIVLTTKVSIHMENVKGELKGVSGLKCATSHGEKPVYGDAKFSGGTIDSVNSSRIQMNIEGLTLMTSKDTRMPYIALGGAYFPFSECPAQQGLPRQ